MKEKTNDRIENIINPESISGTTWMILVNAIHFKADWDIPFQSKLTKLEPFQMPENNDVIEVNMMNGVVDARVADLGPPFSAKAFELPYKDKQVLQINNI